MDIQEWTERRRREDDRLYEKHGRPLENEHWGELIAIGPDGRIIFGEGRQSGEVAKEAIDKFGGGNFVLTSVGERVVGQWLML